LERTKKLFPVLPGKTPLKTVSRKRPVSLSAHFDLEKCKVCPLYEACPVKFQKKEAVLPIKSKIRIGRQGPTDNPL